MINVRLDTNRLEVTGHAKRPDGVPSGSNIICAAVSALTLTLVEGLTGIAEETVKVQQNDGYMAIEWETLGIVGQALVDTWFLGILKIQEAYGEIMII